MLQIVNVDSQNGVILRVNNEKHKGENKGSHDKEEDSRSED